MEDVVDVHERVVQEDDDAEAGIENLGDVEYVIDHVRHGHFGEGPVTIHDKAFQVLRLLTANHPFVDGNKRTALGTTVLFYFGNGYELEYAAELEAMLLLLAIREDFVDDAVAAEYLESATGPLEAASYDSLSTLIRDVFDSSWGEEDNG